MKKDNSKNWKTKRNKLKYLKKQSLKIEFDHKNGLQTNFKDRITASFSEKQINFIHKRTWNSI